ncbi:MAG: hypothetical protein LBU32_22435 [Clostridiales bacterium]|jgi:hypothetical protein|nr:hypothetical protein [Clostridiales bacterium]
MRSNIKDYFRPQISIENGGIEKEKELAAENAWQLLEGPGALNRREVAGQGLRLGRRMAGNEKRIAKLRYAWRSSIDPKKHILLRRLAEARMPGLN